MKTIGDTKEFKNRRNIILKGFDPISTEGFTQIPNLVLKDEKLSSGAKLCYAVLLMYAWQEDRCFPGQEKMAKDTGMGKRSIIRFLKELKKIGYLKTKRRGLGKTNIYYLYCTVKRS